MGGLFIAAVNDELAAIARQGIGANQRQGAFGVAFTVGAQVMPFNITAKRVAQRLNMAGRTGVNAVR